MFNHALNLKKPIPLTLILGIFGGIALILAPIITNNGPNIFISYAVLVVITFGALRLVNLPNFAQRISTAFLSFMFATIVLYIFVLIRSGNIANIPVWGHVWRLGLMAIIGGSLSLNIAYFASNSFKPISTAFLVLLLVGFAIIVAPIVAYNFIGISETGNIAKILVPVRIGFLAMIVGSLGLNVVCLVNIGRTHEA